MRPLFDEDFDALELVEGALVLNQAINPETQVDWAKQELQRLTQEAELALVNESNEQQRFESFLRLFYHEWGFQGDKEAYFDSANAFVDKYWSAAKAFRLVLAPSYYSWLKNWVFRSMA